MVLRRFSFVVTRQETHSQRLHFICQTLAISFKKKENGQFIK